MNTTDQALRYLEYKVVWKDWAKEGLRAGPETPLTLLKHARTLV